MIIVNTGIVISNKNGWLYPQKLKKMTNENISCFVSKTGDLEA